jgi:hypothetical protein
MSEPTPLAAYSEALTSPEGVKAAKAAERVPATRQLEKYIQELQDKKPEINWTPLAAFVDTINKNSGGFLTKAAESMKGMSEEQKAEKVVKLQDLLAQRQIQESKAQQTATNADLMNKYREGRLDLGKQSLANQGQRIGILTDKTAAAAGNKITDDSIMKKIETQRQQIALDKHTLDTADVLTPQIFNEIQTGLANAIAGGRTAAVSSQNKVEFDSVAIQAARIKQRLTNHPEDIGSPDVRKMISDTLSRLDEAYQNNAYARGQKLRKGMSTAYSHVPAAVQVMDEKLNDLRPPPAEDVPPETKVWNGKTFEKKNGSWVEVE